jgi:uncharacterized membrane protein (Fun14 family)
MSDSASQLPTSESSKTPRRAGPVVWILILLSIVLMGGGIAWGMLSQDSAPTNQPAPCSSQTQPGINQSELDPLLIDGFTGQSLPGGFGNRSAQTTDDPQPTSATTEPGTPEAVFRLGFGFAAGFAAAFALKKLLKITIFAAGLVMLLLAGLQHAELIEIHWGAMADRYDSLEDWASAQFTSARAFATGAIPMTATAMAGLAAGWKAS